MTRLLLYAACVLAALGLAVGFFSLSPWLSLGLALFGAAWTWGLRRDWGWFATVGLFLSCTAAAIGIVLGQPPLFLVLGGCLSLLAWDLSDFSARLRRASPGDDVFGMEKRHFLRLGLIALISLAVVLLARAWPIRRIGFEWFAVLALAGAWGVGRIAYWMQRGR